MTLTREHHRYTYLYTYLYLPIHTYPILHTYIYYLLQLSHWTGVTALQARSVCVCVQFIPVTVSTDYPETLAQPDRFQLRARPREGVSRS